ncbi:MAG TPA: PrgI family protein [Anaerolineales bacterium]|nr:PrgI family protein [Anaerolineales bacterium]
MIQHPIPQNVTSYQFRLIGDMTIKQFIFLSTGIGFAIAFYYSNLFFFFKWFFVFLSSMIGFAIAFMPFEGRPLDQWFVNYLRAIYRPTFFIWKKQSPIPDYFTHTVSISPQAMSDAAEISKIAAIRRQQGLSSYLTTLPQDNDTDLDARERAAAKNFTSLFQLSPPPPVARTPAQATLNIPIPKATTPQIHSPHEESETIVPLSQLSPSPESSSASTTIITEAPTNTTAATTSSTLPFPSSPTVPNVIVGMVIDPAGKIVPEAIVEVIDQSGLPARATKTNQLGQFFSTTPLKRGTYYINIDKPGLNFDTIELQLTGQVVEPLKIQAKT